MSIDIAVVPVAGFGTRLLPLTKSQPKEMLPVGRKPVVQYVLEELALSGIRRQLFITGPGKTAIENHFDVDAELIQRLRVAGREELLKELAFERQDMDYFYTRQRRQLGLGHAVLCAQPLIGNSPFVVALGDSIIGLNAQSNIVRRMIEVFQREQAAAVIAMEEVAPSEVSHYGIAKPRGDGGAVFLLDDLMEKPSIDEAPSNLAIAARYVCSPQVFEALAQTKPGAGGEIQLTDALRNLIASGARLFGVRLLPDEKRYDIGNFESYFRAFAEFALADPDYGDGLRVHLQKLLECDGRGAERA
jgi:UTP--glucose-1-phosphate uridylyltransferase